MEKRIGRLVTGECMMFGWFKNKVIVPEYKKGIPSKLFNGIYSRRDKGIDAFLDEVLKHSYLLDTDGYYAYYRMPDRQILSMWIANDCAARLSRCGRGRL